ncbi:MAG: hypothetical protein ACPLXP_03205 [Microgenomates group bacterium]
MKLLLSAHFKKDYQKLPPHIKKKVQKQLKILTKDLAHPSLRVKKMKGQPRFWEARADRFWRMSFQKGKNKIRLCRVGPHDILRK